MSILSCQWLYGRRRSGSRFGEHPRLYRTDSTQHSANCFHRAEHRYDRALNVDCHSALLLLISSTALCRDLCSSQSRQTSWSATPKAAQVVDRAIRQTPCGWRLWPGTPSLNELHTVPSPALYSQEMGTQAPKATACGQLRPGTAPAAHKTAT